MATVSGRDPAPAGTLAAVGEPRKVPPARRASRRFRASGRTSIQISSSAGASVGPRHAAGRHNCAVVRCVHQIPVWSASATDLPAGVLHAWRDVLTATGPSTCTQRVIRSNARFHGIKCSTVAEAVQLAPMEGFSGILVAYPTLQHGALDQACAAIADGHLITLTVDAPAQLDYLAQAALRPASACRFAWRSTCRWHARS